MYIYYIRFPYNAKNFSFHWGPNIFKNMKSVDWIYAMSQFLCIQNSWLKQSASHIAKGDIPTFRTEEQSFVAEGYGTDNALAKLQN